MVQALLDLMLLFLISFFILFSRDLNLISFSCMKTQAQKCRNLIIMSLKSHISLSFSAFLYFKLLRQMRAQLTA